MKIHAVKDESGKIVATYDPAPAADGSKVEAVVPEGHTVEPLEVAENYHEHLHLLYGH